MFGDDEELESQKEAEQVAEQTESAEESTEYVECPNCGRSVFEDELTADGCVECDSDEDEDDDEFDDEDLEAMTEDEDIE